MILFFDLISLAAALVGLYFMARAARVACVYERGRWVESGVLLAIICALALAASYVGMMR
jgi:hypothetical protein